MRVVPRSHFHRTTRRSARRGAAVVELAVLLPLLVFLFVVGCDWCRIFFAVNTLNDCARSGALAASGIAYLERGLTDAQRIARGKTEALKDAANLQPKLTPENVSVACQSESVTVTVAYRFEVLAPFPGVGKYWDVSRVVSMPYQP